MWNNYTTEFFISLNSFNKNLQYFGNSLRGAQLLFLFWAWSVKNERRTNFA